jgi:hypothetical protein
MSDKAFAKVVAALTNHAPDVEPPSPEPQSGKRSFGANALKVNGKIFAMLVRGALVIKLPKARVQTLIESGAGAPFDAGKGKPMKEWVTLEGDERKWTKLAREAYAFVRGG